MIYRQRFTCTINGHNKWWEYVYDDVTRLLKTSWGSIGKPAGQSNMKTNVSHLDLTRLVNSKVRKGYVLLVTQSAEEQDDEWSPLTPEPEPEPLVVHHEARPVNAGGVALRRRRHA